MGPQGGGRAITERVASERALLRRRTEGHEDPARGRGGLRGPGQRRQAVRAKSPRQELPQRVKVQQGEQWPES